MKFLIIEQDLRVYGSSQGIIEHSFLGKLRKSYQNARIDILYLSYSDSQDDLDFLPVDSIERRVVKYKINFFKRVCNKLYYWFFNKLYVEDYIHKQYAKEISAIDYEKYDHIIIRSSGIAHETILSLHNLPILRKSIICFHDPYPLNWYSSDYKKVDKRDFLRLKKMMEVVYQSKTCCTSAKYMSSDLQFLYATKKYFYTLPHHFDDNCFDLIESNFERQKNDKITIAYHGALQFDRDLSTLLDAYSELVVENEWIKWNTEFILRLKSNEVFRLKKTYSESNNIFPLEGTDFKESYFEQKYLVDINVILENGPTYCPILVGKAPVLDFINKPVFIISPLRSELREIVKNDIYIATHSNKDEIKMKLENLIIGIKEKKQLPSVFGDYFSDENFKRDIENIIYQKKSIY